MHKTGLKRMGMTGNPHPKDLSKSPAVAGFFVYRHLGLAGCNIAIMKQFLTFLFLELCTYIEIEFNDKNMKWKCSDEKD